MSATPPAPTLTYQQAMEYLDAWCKDHQTKLVRILSCTQANFAAEPYYIVRVRVFSPKTFGLYALHIHRDGSVDIVHRERR